MLVEAIVQKKKVICSETYKAFIRPQKLPNMNLEADFINILTNKLVYCGISIVFCGAAISRTQCSDIR